MKKSICIAIALMILATTLNAQIAVPRGKAVALTEACATCTHGDTANIKPLEPVFIQKQGTYQARNMASGSGIVSTEGRSFWLTFMQNYNNTIIPRHDIVISTRQTGTVTITNPNTNWSDTVNITANSVTIKTIPRNVVECLTANTVIDKGIHVVSTVPISLYSSNYAEYTFDAANILPDSALSTDYIIQTYTSSNNGGEEFVVVATENNTTVEITTTTLRTVTLNAGQAYMLTGTNLSGSMIHADKKVAVFNGDICTLVPAGNPSCDHIYEQAIPINAWGKEFVLSKTFGRNYDKVRITALTNNTVVSLNGSVLQTLAARSSYELQLNNNSAFLSTSEPVACYLYVTGAGSNSDGIGDPSMVWISPVEQRVNQITFASLDSTICHDHYVNVVVPTTGISDMKIDGQVITGFTPVIGNSAYSYKQHKIRPGVHTLENTTSGFLGHIYGLGKDESYAYNVGSNMKVINNYDIEGNDRGEVFMEDTITATICSGDYYLFRGDSIRQSGIYFDTVEVDAESYSIHMLQLSVVPAVRSNTSAMICRGGSYTFAGRTITNAGLYYDTLRAQNGCDSIIQLSLNYYPTATSTVHYDICEGESFVYRGREIFAAGYAQRDTVVMDTMMTVLGCDSVITIIINVHPAIRHREVKHVCPGTHYNFRGRDVWQAGTYFDNVPTDQGCDEIYELHLIIDTAYHTMVFDTVYTGDARYNHYLGRGMANSGTYYDTMRTVYGCDSICEIHLTVLQTPTKVTICQGESYELLGETYYAPGTYNYRDSLGTIQQFTLVVNPTYHLEFYETVCQGSMSSLNGKTYTEVGSYIDSLTLMSSRGCDSTVIFNIEVQTAYYEERSITICDYDSFMFGNRMVNATGVYRDTLPTVGGCDSMIVLNVRVVKTTYMDTVTLCFGDSILWYGAWRSGATDYYYSDSVSVEGMCDCAVNRYLHINYVGGTVLSSVEPSYMCADEHEYSLYLDWQGYQPEYYNITYTDPNLASSCNIYNESFQTSDIVVPFIETVEPGFYEAEVELYSGECHNEMSKKRFMLEVRYPNTIMNQHWNDVVAVYNKDYNGGYDFYEFEWYVNGVKQYDENGSNLYLTSLQVNDEVTVRVRSTEIPDLLFSCPLIIKDVSASEESEFPVIVSGTPYTIRANANCTYQLYSLSGQILMSGSLAEGVEKEIVLPYASGCYFLRVSTATESRTFKLLKQ